MEYKCGCKTFIDESRVSLGYQIEYCPKHKSAPDMYEALERLMVALEKHGSVHNDVRVAYNLVKPALAKANPH